MVIEPLIISTYDGALHRETAKGVKGRECLAILRALHVSRCIVNYLPILIRKSPAIISISNFRLWLFGTVIITLAVLIADLMTPLGIAVYMFYFFAVISRRASCWTSGSPTATD